MTFVTGIALLSLFAHPAFAQEPHDGDRWSFVIHAGAGTIKRENLTPEKDSELRAALNRAAGSRVKNPA